MTDIGAQNGRDDLNRTLTVLAPYAQVQREKDSNQRAHAVVAASALGSRIRDGMEANGIASGKQKSHFKNAENCLFSKLV